MRIEIECPDCDGCGIIQDRKGKETTCPTCKGKAKIYEEVTETPEDYEGSITEDFDSRGIASNSSEN